MGLLLIFKNESLLNFQPLKLDYVTLCTHTVECQGSLKRTRGMYQRLWEDASHVAFEDRVG